MQLQDTAIILSVRPYREQDALVCAFGREHGLLRGIVKYGLSSKQRGVYCPGNEVDLVWSARLEEHLGTLKGELLSSGGALVMGHRQRCYALQAMCSLVEMAFEQRDPHPQIYRAMQLLMESMRFDLSWQADYARFEAVLLREAGFGLGLERCIVTGQTQDLVYVSPKSGCAVCEVEGRAYHEKLFAYPAVLTQAMHVEVGVEAIAAALRVTSHFLQRWLFPALEKPEPAARKRLVDALGKVRELV